MKSFYLPTHDQLCVAMLKSAGYGIADSAEDADALLFTGGEDVTPLLYGELPLPATYCNPARDRREIKVFKDVPSCKPKIGICRGGQFLNVMCGGSMWQHVDNHGLAGTHKIKISNYEKAFMATSTHHQMMIEGDRGVVLGSAREATKKHAEKLSICKTPDEDEWTDAEIIYYDDFCCLCFQPHPEYKNGAECREAFFEIVKPMLAM